LPVPRLVFGVLVPVTGLAGEADHDQVLPAIAIDVVGPAAETLTVSAQAVAVVAGRLTDLVHLPVGGLVPDLAEQNVHLAVLVDLGDGHALGGEVLVDDRLLPADWAGRGLILAGGGGHTEEQRRKQKSRGQAQTRSHGETSLRAGVGDACRRAGRSSHGGAP